MQRALVSVEVALCLALVMAGAVLIQGLRDLSRRSPGYESAGVLTVQIRLPDAAYKTAELRAVGRATYARSRPRTAGRSVRWDNAERLRARLLVSDTVNVKDRPTPDGQPHTVQFRRISPDYFKVMQIKTLARTRVHAATTSPNGRR